jgi:hypothetical protein
MRKEFAPATMLLDISSSAPSGIRLAVKHDQCEDVHVDSAVGVCTVKIKGGEPTESYHVLRETDIIKELLIPQGVVFTGDFKYAGVRWSGPPPLEAHLHYILSRLLEEASKMNSNQKMLEILGDSKMQPYCQLHITTMPKECAIYVPQDTVGF